MNLDRLQGPQYVRLVLGVAERIAPFVGVPAAEIGELWVDLEEWPDEIQPAPLRGLNGKLIAGDPVLLDATAAGLLFHAGRGAAGDGMVLVRWAAVESMDVLPASSATEDNGTTAFSVFCGTAPS